MDTHHFILYLDEKSDNRDKDHTCKTHYLVEPDDTLSDKNDNIMSRLSFDLDMGSMPYDGGIAVNLVLYKQNKHRIVSHSSPKRTIHVEYLSYYMEKPDHHKSGEFSFPSFKYDIETHNRDNQEGIDVFKEECIRQIMHLFAFSQKPAKKRVQFGYKGIVHHENVVYAFFDMNQIETFFKHTRKLSSLHVWAVVDEILNKGNIFSIKIDEAICSLFKKHPVVWDITHDGETFTYPVVLYPLCETKNETKSESESEIYEYDNETYSSTKSVGKHHIELLPYSYSDIFGERYLFTFRPIPNKEVPRLDNGLPAYKRVVCFMHNPQFIFSEKIESHKQWIDKYPENFVENIDLDDEDLIMSYHKIPCICFTQKMLHHHAMEFYGCIYSDLFEEIDPFVVAT